MSIRDRFKNSIAKDFLRVTDGLEEITYTSVATAGNTEITGIKSLRREVTKKDLELNPIFTGQDTTVFNIAVTDVADPDTGNLIAAKQNDKITEADNTVWVVKSVQKQTLNSRYRLICMKSR